MIGIVSHDEDLHAATVRSHLDSLGVGYVQLDTADMPDRIGLDDVDATWWRLARGVGHRRCRRGRPARMWWRRPQPYMPSDGVTSQQDRMFVVGECGGRGVGPVVLPRRSVGQRSRSRRSGLAQDVATEGGKRARVRVPRTCMTNSPERARQFIAGEAGDVIYKAFRRTPETWRETRIITVRPRSPSPRPGAAGAGDLQEAILADATSGSRWSATAQSRPRSPVPPMVTSTTSGSTPHSRRSHPSTFPTR